jgi:hypothetical protein
MMDYISKILLVCGTSIGLLLGISQIASGVEPTTKEPLTPTRLPETPQYLIEARFYQGDSFAAMQDEKPASPTSIGGARKAIQEVDTKDFKKNAKVIASPRVLVLEKQEAKIHLGENLGIETSTSVGGAVESTSEFIPIGTVFTVRIEKADNGKIRVNFTLERTTGQVEKDVDVVVTEGVRVHGSLEVESDKSVKACDIVSKDSKRVRLELIVHNWHPEPTSDPRQLAWRVNEFGRLEIGREQLSTPAGSSGR